jgi:hypothetical protein
VATVNWSVDIAGTSFTDITQSLSFSLGRTSFFDSWTGNNLILTVRNNEGQAVGLAEGDQITIGNDLSAIDLYFYVVEVSYQDDLALEAYTATITATDAFGMLSLFYVNDDPIIGTTNAIRQAVKLANEVYPFVPPYPPPAEYDGRAIISDAFDPTTIGQRIGDILFTENSSYWYDGATIEFHTSAAPDAALFNFTRNTATGIVYNVLNRKYPNANYPNVVNLTSTTVGTTSASSASNYERNYNRQVLFNNTLQQQDQTDYFAAVLAQEALYADISFVDMAQTTSKMTAFLDAMANLSGLSTSLTYYAPAFAAETTIDLVMEGATVSAVPGVTNVTVFCSPLNIYDLFTLNSADFGILDTNRLGW